MSSLTAAETLYLEEILEMGGGYVLDFSDRTFADFFNRHNISIHSDKYQTSGRSKARKLRAFWELEADSLVGPVLLEMIEICEVQCSIGRRDLDSSLLARGKEIAFRLSGQVGESTVTSDDGFLNEEFTFPDLDKLPVNSAVIDIIQNRLGEAQACLQAGAFLSVIFQSGSVLEAVLLGAAEGDPRSFNQSQSSPKQQNGKVKHFQDWKLSEFIDVAKDIGLLQPDVQRFSHELRHFRNYIHPYQQMATGFAPDEHTAKVCMQVLKAALADVTGERRQAAKERRQGNR